MARLKPKKCSTAAPTWKVAAPWLLASCPRKTLDRPSVRHSEHPMPAQMSLRRLSIATNRLLSATAFRRVTQCRRQPGPAASSQLLLLLIRTLLLRTHKPAAITRASSTPIRLLATISPTRRQADWESTSSTMSLAMMTTESSLGTHLPTRARSPLPSGEALLLKTPSTKQWQTWVSTRASLLRPRQCRRRTVRV